VKPLIITILFICFSCFTNQAKVPDDFYQVFSSDSVQVIDNYLILLQQSEQTSQVKAFTGALLMKKACLEKKAKAKLEAFKMGHQLLEAEIKGNPDNIEYRFLRLVIQEHAPEIMKYKSNITEDKQRIVFAYKSLHSWLKSQIRLYCAISKIISTKDIEDGANT
jgi:hypothetical protein